MTDVQLVNEHTAIIMRSVTLALQQFQFIDK